MTYGSLFTGIGGFDLGFDRAGMQCNWQVERDKDCNRVLSQHWPDTQRGNDVCAVTPERFGRVDVICGGFPCQDLSVAGNRKGLAGERSGLWHEFRRIVAEFKPRIVVIENVPGLYSSHGGRDFLTVIRGMAELDYCLAGALLDSQYRGVPQRRDRVFLVGSLGDGRCAEILFEPESVRGDSPPSREAGEGAASAVARSLRARGNASHREDSDTYIPAVAPAMTTRDCKGTRMDIAEHALIDHTLRAEGCDASEDGTGRGVPLVTASLVSNGDSHSGFRDENGIVAIGAFKPNQGAKSRGIGFSEHVSPTLEAAEGGNNKPCVAFNWQDSHAFRAEDECTNPLRANQTEAVLFQDSEFGIKQYDTAGALRAGREPHHQMSVVNMMVRRLTPRECERLQGFPDDWTRYDASGKEISDSARYRMLGNAVTVPVAEWIGQQIVKHS